MHVPRIWHAPGIMLTCDKHVVAHASNMHVAYCAYRWHAPVLIGIFPEGAGDMHLAVVLK